MAFPAELSWDAPPFPLSLSLPPNGGKGTPEQVMEGGNLTSVQRLTRVQEQPTHEAQLGGGMWGILGASQHRQLCRKNHPRRESKPRCLCFSSLPYSPHPILSQLVCPAWASWQQQLTAAMERSLPGTLSTKDRLISGWHRERSTRGDEEV